MDAELHVLTGERAGTVLALATGECTVGRHLAAALRFASPADASVSARHARVVREEGGWVLHDLESTNGTWLNGRRLAAPALLRDGDRIVLGADGPVLEFRLAGDARHASDPPRPGRTGWRAVAGAAAVAVLGGAGALRLSSRPADTLPAPSPIQVAPRGGPGAAPPPSFAGVPAFADSPAPSPPSEGSSRSRRPPAVSPQAEAPRSRTKTRANGTRPIAAPSAADSVAEAPRVMDVGRRNRMAVARVYVEDNDGEVTSGTAFAVRGDATLVTNRHVVVGEDGRGAPRRIAVQFAASAQVWPARVVAVSGDDDLAVLKVEGIEGAVPTVRGFNLRPDTLPAGALVLVAGFPAAGEPVEGSPARLALVPATLAAVRGGRVELFARSAGGASGSPVFDADGRVVAVLFGGAPHAPRPLLFGVAAPAVAALVP